MNQTNQPERLGAEVEHFLTIKSAAKALGLQYWVVLGAVNNGDVPFYRLGNTRRRVRISEVEAVMAAAGSRGVSR